MKRLLRILLFGILAWGALLLSIPLVGSGFGPSGPAGRFWWLTVPFLLPSIVGERLGLGTGFTVQFVGITTCVVLTGAVAEAAVMVAMRFWPDGKRPKGRE